MNKRLKLISDYIDNGKGIADVGTDHGYLPIFLAENGYTGNIFASDINEDPINKAIKNAAAAGVSDKINFMLCDGLRMCPRAQIDTIVIAGMGGDMIVKILDETEWCLSPEYKLILQPMSKAEILRYWLVYNGFEIKHELLVDENGTIYQIIVARFGGISKLNDAQLYIGCYEDAQQKELYIKNYSALYRRFDRAVKEIKEGENIPLYRLRLFEDILAQLKEMGVKHGFNK